MKGHYRSKLCTRLVAELDLDLAKSMKDVLKEINLLDAIHLLAQSWDCVKSTTIANCFRYGGFVKDDSQVGENENDILADVEIPGPMTVEDLENCISIDEDACVTGESTDSELVLQAKRLRGQDEEEEDEALDDSIPSNIDIMNALKIVR